MYVEYFEIKHIYIVKWKVVTVAYFCLRVYVVTSFGLVISAILWWWCQSINHLSQHNNTVIETTTPP